MQYIRVEKRFTSRKMASIKRVTKVGVKREKESVIFYERHTHKNQNNHPLTPPETLGGIKKKVF